MRNRLLLVFLVTLTTLTILVNPQTNAHAQNTEEEEKKQNKEQISDSFSDPLLRIQIDFMAGYGHDGANASLGFEKQGRVGYAIVTLDGLVNKRVSYRLAINPVNETYPLPACGEPGFFFPNDPKFLYGNTGPNVPCEPKNGNRRVDAYRGIALDVISQQGAIREAWINFQITDGLNLIFGRKILPIGFNWEEAGSFTAKDATRIQRINAESNFVLMLSAEKKRSAKPLISMNLAASLGENNRFWDYDYFYFEDGSLDANSALTALVSGAFSPTDSLEFRTAYKYGYTGSKVERLPSYWASKRNDMSIVFGLEYKPFRYFKATTEWASYKWGPTRTSAEMIGVDQSPIKKTGYWFTGEIWYPISRELKIGGSVSREEVDRADSLVKYMALNKMYKIEEGKKDRMTVVRVYFDITGVRIGFYRTFDSNPYPWLSGIWPVEGERAFTGKDTNKWGVMVRMTNNFNLR
jgi:hypothetical protein